MCIFDHQPHSDRFTLIGIPSGEVLEVNGIQFYNLYENDLVNFNWEKEFWFILDENMNKIRLKLK
jgi:hypothetical protein